MRIRGKKSQTGFLSKCIFDYTFVLLVLLGLGLGQLVLLTERSHSAPVLCSVTQSGLSISTSSALGLGESNPAYLGGDCIIAFTAGTGTWTVPSGVTRIQALVVGGGGGGGSRHGGGGGGGGVVYVRDYPVQAGTAISISVGPGGAGNTTGTAGSGGSGTASTFKIASNGLTAQGGGGGGPGAGGSGGSGGGSSSDTTAGGTSTQFSTSQKSLTGLDLVTGNDGNADGTYLFQYGNDGGKGIQSDASSGNYCQKDWCGGGGGGSDAVGGNASRNGFNQGSGYGAPGNGGNGKQLVITASFINYAGGGGGASSDNGVVGNGGSGGGGSGGNANVSAQSGTDNLGGGGGGGGFEVYADGTIDSNNTVDYAPTGFSGGTGGSGVVVVRYRPDTTAPTVTNVTSNKTNGSYKSGEIISIQITFSETVNVVTSGGSPTLTLETGLTDRSASYASGSGSNQLTFTYTSQSGDTAANLDYVAVDSLTLNGATIKDGAGNSATLTLPNPAAANSLGANKSITIDTTAPTALSDVDLDASSDSGSTNSDNITSDTTPTISVTGYEAGATLTITASKADSSSVTCTATASSCTLGTLAQGTWSVVATQQDAAGNTSTSSAALSITIDTTAPTATWMPPTSLSNSRGPLTYTLAFSESVSGIASGDFSNNGGTATGCAFTPSAASGTSITVAVTCTSDGTVVLRLASGGASDTAGNTNASNTDAASVTIDTTAPTLSATSATSVSDTSASLNLTSSESGTYFYLIYAAADVAPNAATVIAQGTAVNKASGASLSGINSFFINGLSASTSYKAYVIVRDPASNVSSVATIELTSLAASSCALGGSCSLGDTGPGGGIVFYDAGSTLSWGRYLEAAPSNWSGGLDSDLILAFCVKDSVAQSTVTAYNNNSLGGGKSNTDSFVNTTGCNGGAVHRAKTYSGGGKSDWYLPNGVELAEMWGRRISLSLVDDASLWGYWSSNEVSDEGFMGSLVTANGLIGATNKLESAKNKTRPIRAITPIVAPNITVTSGSVSVQRDSALSSYSVTNNGTASTYTVSPSLPSGITLNSTTGLISGTPSTVQSSTTYTLTATNDLGNSTATFTITVTEIPSSGGGGDGGAPALEPALCVAPRIEEVVPNWSDSSGGTRVKIIGHNLSPSVYFEGRHVDVLLSSANSVTVITPGGRKGKIEIQIDGCGSSSKTTFIYDPDPKINSLSSEFVSTLGGELILMGDFLGDATVELEGAIVGSASKGSSMLVATLPPGKPGSKILTVRTNYGATTVSLVYVTPPQFAELKLPFIAQGDTVSIQISAEGAYSYVLFGSLPTGMTFDSKNGLISGIANKQGTFDFEVVAYGKGGLSNKGVRLEVDRPIPKGVRQSIYFSRRGDVIINYGSLVKFIDKVKAISPRNLAPLIRLRGGGQVDRLRRDSRIVEEIRQDKVIEIFKIHGLNAFSVAKGGEGPKNWVIVEVLWKRS